MCRQILGNGANNRELENDLERRGRSLMGQFSNRNSEQTWKTCQKTEFPGRNLPLYFSTLKIKVISFFETSGTFLSTRLALRTFFRQNQPLENSESIILVQYIYSGL
jgi:hypothetical protein